MAFYSPLSNQFNNYLWTLFRVFTQKYKFNCTIETEKAEETVLSQQQIARLISYSLTRLIKKKNKFKLTISLLCLANIYNQHESCLHVLDNSHYTEIYLIYFKGKH